MNQNQKLTVTLIAATVALIAVLVGILSYFRKKSIEFDESWDYGYAYDSFEDDCDCDCDHHGHHHVHESDFDESILVEENN